MFSYVVRRILQSVIVLLVVGLVAFSMFNFVGDPIDNMLGQERTQEDIDRLRAQLGLDRPFPVQYWKFLVNAAEGNLGVSYRQGRPVAEIIAERLPATLELAMVSGVLAILFGIVLGVFTGIARTAAHARPTLRSLSLEVPGAFALAAVLMAWLTPVSLSGRVTAMLSPALQWPWILQTLVLPGVLLLLIRFVLHPGTRAPLIMTLSLIGVSLPTFLIGILLIYVFSVELDMLPSFGRGEVVDLGWWTTGFLTGSGLQALILPAITLGLYQMTLIMRLVRSEMLEVLRQDYIRFARARGLSERVINFRHALKNTMVPVITVTGLQLGSIIAFAIITETVFQWPGVGLLFINAIQFVDVPVMAAYLMMISVLFVGINLVVDLLYVAIDPRLRS